MPNFLTTHALEIVRSLAFASLFGLLLAIGLQTSFKALISALRQVRLEAAVLGNFVLIPILATALIAHSTLDHDATSAMIFLASSPFAPVVPLFVRMARGYFALATGLTAIFPAFSALLTPLAVGISCWLIQDAVHEMPSPMVIFSILTASITLPLTLGIVLRTLCPKPANRLQKPVEWLAEAIGVCSLAFLIALEARHLSSFHLDEAWPHLVFYDASFFVGLLLGQGPLPNRLVLAFGTANRNIGLAILLGATVTDDPQLLAQILGQSLLMIVLGLIHVALFRVLLGTAGFGGRIQVQ